MVEERSPRWTAAILSAASIGCCLLPKPNAVPVDGAPIESVVESVQRALADQGTVSALKTTNLKVKDVTLALQVQTVMQGEVAVDVLLTAGGSTAKTSTALVTLKLEPPKAEGSRPALSDFLRSVDRSQLRAFDAVVATAPPPADLKLAKAIAFGAKGAQMAFCGGCKLDTTEIDTEFDFAVTNVATIGLDVKIGSVGVVGKETRTSKDTQQVIVTFVPTRKMRLEDCKIEHPTLKSR